jgi:phosphomethylpyrimidine synthase
MTIIESARSGKVTDEIRVVAEDEGIDADELRDKVAQGEVVIPKNINHDFIPRGIGKGLRTKTNANIGTSPDHRVIEEELEKLKVAQDVGVDSIMDLSTGGDLDLIRKELLSNCKVIFGTVPIYQAACNIAAKQVPLEKMEPDSLFDVIERHGEDGVDFITVHCGVTRNSLSMLEADVRIGGVVSRGGAILAKWMSANDMENPLYDQFDRLLDIARKYDITLSLGDGLRPGAIADATDSAQLAELLVLGELTGRARDAGVQVMIEGPGHVPLDQIETNVKLEKRVCDGAPFYVLGPLPIDIAPGYDHITAAIGGAISAASGADFLCYVTPAEHLRLPTIEDVREGVIASMIAANCGDIAKGVKGAWERNRDFSVMRKRLDWEGMYENALDPRKAREYRKMSEAYEKNICTMCGSLCAVHIDNVKDNRKQNHNESVDNEGEGWD